MDGSQPLDPRKTIFVGGVPRPLRAGRCNGECQLLTEASTEMADAVQVTFSNAFSLFDQVMAWHQTGDRSLPVPMVMQVCDIYIGYQASGS